MESEEAANYGNGKVGKQESEKARKRESSEEGVRTLASYSRDRVTTHYGSGLITLMIVLPVMMTSAALSSSGHSDPYSSRNTHPATHFRVRPSSPSSGWRTALSRDTYF